MADRLLLESGAPDGYLLEDSSGVLLIDGRYVRAVQAISGLFGHWRLGETTGTVAYNEIVGSTLDYLNTPTLGVTGLLNDDPDTAVTYLKSASEDTYRGTGVAAGGSTGQSVAAWIKLGSFAAAETHAFWSWAAQSTTIGFHTLYFNATDATTGTLRWRYSDGTAVRTAISSSFTPGTSTHFITVRHDYAAETVIFGIDGVEETVDVSANGAPVAIISGKPIDIGADVVNVNYYFNGTIDDVAVWTVPITAGNVADLYAAGTPDVSATNAAAEVASGTGAASGVSASLKPNTTAAAGTGAANNAAASVKPNAGVGTGTGSASGALGSDQASAIQATGSGQAFNATVTAVGITNAAAGAASGSGTAFDAAAAYAKLVAPEVATGTGAASNASTAIASGAGAAVGTGSVGSTGSSIGVNASVATATGAASNATGVPGTSAVAETASGTGAAQGVSASVAATSNTAGGSGTAGGANGSEQASAILATGSGLAFDAVASTATFKNVDAELAEGTGAAFDAATIIGVNAGTSTGSGDANDAAVQVSGAAVAQAGAATGTGSAHPPTITAVSGGVVEPPIRFARPTRLRLKPETKVEAGVATGTGQASGASVIIFTEALAARATATANDATTTWDDDETALFMLLGDREAAA